MNIIGRKIVGSAVAAVAATGLVFATTAPAAAVTPHMHCLETPSGWVLIAEGVSEYAPNDPALVNFHEEVHRGEPQDQLTIQPIFMTEEDCSRWGQLVAAN
jgi:hypothetical protein